LKRLTSLPFFIVVAISLSVSCAFSLLLLPGCSSEAGPTPTEEPTSPVLEEKASSLLLLQIELRQQQIADPNAERLERMKAMGMRVEPIDTQRIFIYLSQELGKAQAEELEGLGITLYPDSWIPPVGSHTAGFLLADMPVDKLNNLASKDYVVRLDTAEQQLQPQDGNMPGGGEPPQEAEPAE
jgi:hypothetical protein